MPRSEILRYAFNRGLISPLALARVDLKRSALSAEIQENWMARALGSMMLRAGQQYLGTTLGNAANRCIEFVRSLDGTHILEFTTGAMRVWTADALLTRAAVTAAVTNGNFDANLANWTDNDEAGGTSAWVAGGYMGLTGNGTAAAIRTQQVAITAGQEATEHALRILVNRGPVLLRVGTSAGADDLIAETTLYTGEHSLAFTPGAASFYIRFFSRLKRQVLVNSCNVEAAGVVSITSPYLAADLDYIRASDESLSVDVLFVACKGYQQRRIERRASGRSWSVVLYQPEDGPFRNTNTGTQTMTPSVLSGNGTLTSSVDFFRTGHVGALFSVTSTGQIVSKSMTVVNDATNSIRVTGVGTDRAQTIVLSGLTGTGNTVILQRSFDDSTWTATGSSWVADVTTAINDGLDNQIVYYRLLCSVYAAGATAAQLSIPTGTITGVGRVTARSSATAVDIEVLVEFGDIVASMAWAEGLWSDYRGWPTAGTLHEGRLGWAGYAQYALSVSDAFDGFDPETEGDSGPIVRSIGSGPLETINWMLPLQRLILGGEMAEHSVRSNAFDEPLTPTNNNRKPCSDRGSAPVQAIKNGSGGLYIQRGGSRLMELFFDGNTGDYNSRDLTILNPDILKGGSEGTAHVVRMAWQHQPDNRAHCVLSDGTAAVMVYDSAEEVKCLVKITSAGLIEDVVVLPGLAVAAEDRVYYTVKFTINGATVRYFLKWALEAECQGGFVGGLQTGALSKQADAFVIAGGGSNILTGLGHLEGETVVVWANGKDLGEYTVAAGSITVTETVDALGAVVGLGYEALFKSAKLGQTISKHKNIDHVAVVLYNTHYQGLEIGQSFDSMDPLPLVQAGAPVAADTVYSSYDTDPQAIPGTWDIDARLCLRATAPRPCTVLAANLEGQVT